MRPGEKLVEELTYAEEGVGSTTHPKIMVARQPVNYTATTWSAGSVELSALVDARHQDAALARLWQLVGGPPPPEEADSSAPPERGDESQGAGG